MNLEPDYHNAQITSQYRTLPTNTRCVVLHPNALNEHHFLQQHILDTLPTIYVHLPIAPASTADVISAISDAFSQQTSIATTIDSSDIAEASDVIGELLFDADISILFLEGYDGDAARYISPLLKALIPELPDGCRIVIKGREMATDLLHDAETLPCTAVIPVDDTRLLVDYVHSEDGRAFLEVRAFSNGVVQVNGTRIERWEGFLPRALFFFFVDRAMTTRDEIFNTFWPKLTVREATNVFHVTKRKISEILGVNLTVYGGGFYRISPAIDLRYDVVLFQEAVQNAAIANDDDAMELYQRAINLYRQDFLNNIDAPWAKKRRDEMRNTYTDAIAGLAKIHYAQGNHSESLGLFLRAAAVAPEREDLARNIMELYAELGAYRHAMDAYKNLQSMLKKAYGVPPDPQTVALMEEIKLHL